MEGIISYILVATYLVVVDRFIALRVKKSVGKSNYDIVKKELKFYRVSILSTIAIFIFIGMMVYFRLITVK